MKRLKLEYLECIGCRLCEVVCAAEKEGVFNPRKSRIRSYRIGIPEQVVISYCHHCDDPKCVDSCSAGAMYKDNNGVVVISEDECTGCRICVDNCGAKAIHWHMDKNMPVKCDLCSGSPVCVKVCPRSALLFGEYRQGELLFPKVLAKKLAAKAGINPEEF